MASKAKSNRRTSPLRTKEILIDPRVLAWEAEVYAADPVGGSPSKF